MGDFYFIIRVCLVLAAVASITFWLGAIVGKRVWGEIERRADEIEEENRRLKEERDALRDPGMRPTIPDA